MLLKIAFGTAVFAIIIFSIPPINDFINLILRLEGYSIRPYLWEAGYKVFINNFFTGVGPGLYGKYCFIYLPSGMIQFFNNMGFLDPGLDIKQTPHSFILYMAAENGLLGIISVLYLYFLYFFLNIKSILYYKTRNKDIYILSISFFATGIGVFWRSFFEVSGIMNYGFLSQDLPFWLIMIIMIYLYHQREEITKPGAKPFFIYKQDSVTNSKSDSV